MTHDQLIAKIQNRVRLYVKGKLQFDVGVVYDALNDASREIAMKTKDRQSSASLSLVAGTSTYTISSAIATDIDEIQRIELNAGTIELRSSDDFHKRVLEDVTEEDQDWRTGTPEIAKIWDGVLTVYPVPSQAATATVYYSVKIPTGFYSSSNGSASIELNDDYLNALIYETIAVLCEQLGVETKAAYYRSQSEMKLLEAQAHRPITNYNQTVTYHNGID